MAWAPRTWSVGEVVSATQLNTEIRDQVNQRAPQLVEQGNDQTVTTSTLTNSNISVTLEPNAVYFYLLFIAYTAPSWSGTPSNVGAIQWLWSPTSAVRDRHNHFIARDNTAIDPSAGHLYINRAPSPTTALVAGASGTGQFRSALEFGKFQLAAGGVATLQFAAAAGTGSTALRSNSWLMYWRLTA